MSKQLSKQQRTLPHSKSKYRQGTVNGPAQTQGQRMAQQVQVGVYQNRLIEAIKQCGQMQQLCTYITTLRLTGTSDEDIVNEINSLFSFLPAKLQMQDFKRTLVAYPEILKAYMRGAMDQTAALSAFLSDYLVEYFTVHTEDAKNAIAWQKNLDDKITKAQEIDMVKNVNDGISEQTGRTIESLAEALANAQQPDFTSPDEEAIAWDNRQEGDD